MRAHANDLRAEVAGWEDAEALVRGVSEDYTRAPLSAGDRAMLDYAVKLTRAPESMSRKDVETLRAAGFSDPAVAEVAQIPG